MESLQSPSIEVALLWGLHEAPLYKGLCKAPIGRGFTIGLCKIPL